MKSYIAKAADIEHNWVVIDAEGKTLGKLAVEAASILRGKKKPTYTPHMDCGDYVIVINAEKVHVTGKKETDKIYVRHTGYPAGSGNSLCRGRTEYRGGIQACLFYCK